MKKEGTQQSPLCDTKGRLDHLRRRVFFLPMARTFIYIDHLFDHFLLLDFNLSHVLTVVYVIRYFISFVLFCFFFLYMILQKEKYEKRLHVYPYVVIY